jgi:hypothetical protein
LLGSKIVVVVPVAVVVGVAVVAVEVVVLAVLVVVVLEMVAVVLLTHPSVHDVAQRVNCTYSKIPSLAHRPGADSVDPTLHHDATSAQVEMPKSKSPVPDKASERACKS